MPEYNLHETVSTADVQQGNLGDCYFISCLSALGEFPDRVRKIFKNYNLAAGCFELELFFHGLKQKLVLDDYFPYIENSKKLAFCSPANKSIWGILLEKAWAKVNSTYANIDEGSEDEAMIFLTGIISEGYGICNEFDDEEEEEQERKERWEHFKSADSKKHILLSSIEPEEGAKLAGFTIKKKRKKGVNLPKEMGLVNQHSYSLISVYELEHEGQPLKLLKLRNPWGKYEWKGSWSDNSELWTPELKAKVGLEEKNDGVFFIELKDYLNQFDRFTTCPYEDGYKHSGTKSCVLQDEFWAVKMTVKDKNEGDKINYFDEWASEGIISNIIADDWQKGIIAPGEYLLFLQADWETTNCEYLFVNAFMKSYVEFSEYDPECKNSTQILEQLLRSYLIAREKKETLKELGAKDIYYYNGLLSALNIKHAGFLVVNNEKETKCVVSIELGEYDKVSEPYTGKKNFEIEVNPGEEKFLMASFNKSKRTWSKFDDEATKVEFKLFDLSGNPK